MDRSDGSSRRRMRDRPDYVPPNWTDGSLNRWTAAKPPRVLAFFAFFVALDVALLVWVVTDTGDVEHHHPVYLVTIPVVSLIFFFRAVKYAPRAWRAMRRGG